MLEAECHDKLAAVYKQQPKRAEEAKSAKREVARLVYLYCCCCCCCYYYIDIILLFIMINIELLFYHMYSANSLAWYACMVCYYYY